MINKASQIIDHMTGVDIVSNLKYSRGLNLPLQFTKATTQLYVIHSEIKRKQYERLTI